MIPSHFLSSGCPLGQLSLTFGLVGFFCLVVFFCIISYGMEYPFDPFGSTVPVLFPPISVSLPSSLTGKAIREAQKTEMSSALCNTAQQQLKHRCVINVFLLKPNQSTVPDTMKENQHCLCWNQDNWSEILMCINSC